MQSEQAYLILTQNDEQKHVYPFTEEMVMTIGRAAENTISFIDDRCSRFHAKVFFDKGKWYIQDLGSRNGTSIDNVSLTAQPYPLRAGQHIQIGRAVLGFGHGTPSTGDSKAGNTKNNNAANNNAKEGNAQEDNIIPPHSGVWGVSETLQGTTEAEEYNLTQARKENVHLWEMLQVNSEIVGISPQIQKVHHLIARAAEGKTALLICGESGTGKELIARAVHWASPRKSKPFICLNCAAISETLLESELFGHEKGAFTGAAERKPGKFEAADTGTLFLDEIGEMSPALQAKMLRVLENNAFERVGGNATITVDVRIMTATHRNLEKEVAAGRFRHDLFFRLRVLEITIPPLRKRPADIPVLAQHFLERFCSETGRKYMGFHPAAAQILMEYRWPGNVRELKNVIERAVVLGTEPLIREQDMLLSQLKTMGETRTIAVGKKNAVDKQEDNKDDLFIPLSAAEAERDHIIRTLAYTSWNKSRAAKLLNIERTTLDRKIKRYNIEE